MKLKKRICLLLALLLTAALLPRLETGAYAAGQTTLTFSDGGVAATVPGSGYSVSGTTLTVTASGVYRVTGSCANGSIVVAKGLQDVTLILDGLSLSCSYSAPLVVKKESSVLLRLEGESTLTDAEDAATEDTNADFEGACVKVKSGSSLTILGDGTLNAVGAAKNGLKGAALSALTVDVKGEAVAAYDPFFGANVITLPGFRAASDLLYAPPGQTRQTPVSVRFIPYYGFANRGESDMTVWFRPAASK